MTKSKISVSLEDDALSMLRTAAEHEGVSISEMAERSVRFHCSDYISHRIEVDVLKNGQCNVGIDRRGRCIYHRRGAERHVSMPIVGSIFIDVPGPIDASAISRALAAFQVPPDAQPLSGTPLSFSAPGIEVQVTNFPIDADGDSTYIKWLLDNASHEVANLEVISLREIIRRRCPMCGTYFIALHVWRPLNSPEEKEWICGVGHRVSSKA